MASKMALPKGNNESNSYYELGELDAQMGGKN